MKTVLRYLSYIILIGGVIISSFFCYHLITHGIILTPEGKSPDMNLTGGIGDFIGGTVGTVFSLAGALLVVVTLREQEEQNRKDRFAQSFYEMVRLHRENVANLHLKKGDSMSFVGREVFSELVADYGKTYCLIHSYCDNLIANRASEAIHDYLIASENRILFEMKIAYGYFFFGSEEYKLRKASDVEEKIQLEIKGLLHFNNYTISSHNVLLGHYYRHLYQTVMMLADERVLSEREKYAYAKQLRAQLNDDEQLLLYYNAMSEIGADWLYTKHKIIGKPDKMCLMARFRMIRNIPFNKVIYGVNPKQAFKNEAQVFSKRREIMFEN